MDETKRPRTQGLLPCQDTRRGNLEADQTDGPSVTHEGILPWLTARTSAVGEAKKTDCQMRYRARCAQRRGMVSSKRRPGWASTASYPCPNPLRLRALAFQKSSGGRITQRV